MAIVSSHTLNGMNGTHASGIRVRLINITQNLEVFISHIDPSGRLEKNVDLSSAQKEDRFQLWFACRASVFNGKVRQYRCL